MDWITGGYTCRRCGLQCSRHRLFPSVQSSQRSVCLLFAKHASAGTLRSLLEHCGPRWSLFHHDLNIPTVVVVVCTVVVSSVKLKLLILIETCLPAMLVRAITCVFDPPAVTPPSACHSQHSSVMTGTGA